MPGSAFGDTMYAEFQTGQQQQENVDFTKPDFHELYDTTKDAWMMNNLYNSTAAATLNNMHNKLHQFFTCAGDACP